MPSWGIKENIPPHNLYIPPLLWGFRFSKDGYIPKSLQYIKVCVGGGFVFTPIEGRVNFTPPSVLLPTPPP